MAKKFAFNGLIREAEKNQQKTKQGVKDRLEIDEELKALIPPLLDDEYDQLKENIRQEGVREPILVAEIEGRVFVIDGHNRHRISSELGIDFPVKEISLDSREAAKDWMINNQLGRRNLTDEQRSYLRGLRYEREKQKVSNASGANQHTKAGEDGGKNFPQAKKTAQRLAEEYNVTDRTIKNDAQFAKGVDLIGKINPELKQGILSGKEKVKKGDVRMLAGIDEQGADSLTEAESVDEIVATAKSIPAKKTKKPKKKTPAKVVVRPVTELKDEICGRVLSLEEGAAKAKFSELRVLLAELEGALIS
ncbi:hypothetical protein FUAX_50050 (plasmid) [Fulvitalea axinellae]|uniref:ParB-like N-terminal domain-containing protein n=1 Tax=Fulvitalea axinellae TaxID=1182444 RepID=A0AAU9CXA2_9BACT|nr:hypothetical protein FUAX_50050 [Fulvitalea axinellae]